MGTGKVSPAETARIVGDITIGPHVGSQACMQRWNEPLCSVPSWSKRCVGTTIYILPYHGAPSCNTLPHVTRCYILRGALLLMSPTVHKTQTPSCVIRFTNHFGMCMVVRFWSQIIPPKIRVRADESKLNKRNCTGRTDQILWQIHNYFYGIYKK